VCRCHLAPSTFPKQHCSLPDFWSYPISIIHCKKEGFFSAAGMVCAYSHKRGRSPNNFPPDGNN